MSTATFSLSKDNGCGKERSSEMLSLLIADDVVLWANVAQYQFLCYSCFSVSNRLCKLTYIQTYIRTFVYVRVKGYFCLAFFRNTVKWYLRGFFHSISFWFIHSFVRSFSALHYDVMMSVVDINFHNDDQTTIKKNQQQFKYDASTQTEMTGKTQSRETISQLLTHTHSCVL